MLQVHFASRPRNAPVFSATKCQCYAKESNPERRLPMLCDLLQFLASNSSHTIHHPLASPPSLRRASALARCARRLVARTTPAERWGRGSSGVHSWCLLLGPAHAALSLDVPHRKVGAWKYGRVQNATCCLCLCCCPGPMCAPPELGRPSPKGGGVEVRACTMVPLLRPPSSPPCVCAAAGRQATPAHTRG